MKKLKPIVSIIIPVHKYAYGFQRCLASISKTTYPDCEIIVVADGPAEQQVEMAKNYSTKILQIDTPAGPAKARNLAAKAAKGEILFFTDSDVMLYPDTIEQVVNIFQNNTELAAVIGSYDDKPAEPNFFSQYKNLFNHYVHQTSNREASTFWTACGGIRSNIYWKINGFNEKFRYPSIEDIEFGYRLKKAGYQIRLEKEILVKHLKHWGFMSLLKTDFFYRAIPWTDLILSDNKFINDLNVKIQDRISVTAVSLLIISLILFLFNTWMIVPILFCMSVLFILNKDLYVFFYNKHGWKFLIKSIGWHWFYFFYSAIAFISVYFKKMVTGKTKT
ncbi:family 2 glycosyl transferase [Candidatus Magnetomorum sp. HK-1]|nr:family 2 glycosyl transferase [Candidatus Magnetomorum sp. HK-1]